MVFLKANHDKKNLLIGQKYVQAGLYLSSKNIENSIKIYEEIIYSKNKFYSILALNTILEENLVSDDKKILEYFKIVEEANKSKKEQIDLITLKKALYLKKIKKNKEGDILLNNLIDNESKFKNIAEEIIAK